MVNAWDRANEKREAREEGREEGFAEGEAKARRAIAKSLIAGGMKASLVATHTGLTEEELAVL